MQWAVGRPSMSSNSAAALTHSVMCASMPTPCCTPEPEPAAPSASSTQYRSTCVIAVIGQNKIKYV
eukprot:1189211-Prorocentrum_minimum.AAC.1